MRREADVKVARAFAPGHVTGIFVPARSGPDPRRHGSIGAGVVLELGVHATATWREGGPTRLSVRSDIGGRLPISRDAALRLLGPRKGTLEVVLVHELPIGQGFGMSAAGATATSLSVARVLGRPRQDATTAAHLADLRGGGGLGGVASILGGGFEVRVRPGVPPFGRVVHAAFRYPIFLVRLGPPIPSPRLLSEPAFLERVRSAASPQLASLTPAVDPGAFLEAAERFADALGLASPSVERALRALRGPQVRATQAMFGHSAFAVPLTARGRRRLIATLERRGWPSIEVHASRTGARAFR
ncbi:MAG: hypothetical protein ACREDK_02360 [Thermoplasmata archaeon]